MTKDLTAAEARALELVVEALRDIKARTGHGRLTVVVEVAAGAETLFEITPTFRHKPPR